VDGLQARFAVIHDVGGAAAPPGEVIDAVTALPFFASSPEV